jgi:pyruvate dehydrogenase E1 component alpha subunit
MSTNSVNPKFYSSAIVGGIIPIALGAAKALNLKNSPNRVWCFIGDMTFETGIFYEAHKYATNFNLPLQFVVEDNNMSTNTPTDLTWNGIKREVPENVIHYSYKREYPHHGTGSWILF